MFSIIPAFLFNRLLCTRRGICIWTRSWRPWENHDTKQKGIVCVCEKKLTKSCKWALSSSSTAFLLFRREIQTSLSLAILSYAFRGTPRHSQTTEDTQFLQWVPGIFRGLLPVGCVQKNFKDRCLGVILTTLTDTSPFHVREQWLSSKLHLDDKEHHPFSKAEPNHPIKEANFGCLCPGSHSLDHYPNL